MALLFSEHSGALTFENLSHACISSSSYDRVACPADLCVCTGADACTPHCHMTPCACHCAACRAAGHGNECVMLRMGLLRLFYDKADIVDLVLRQYYHGASGWDTARFDAVIRSVQYGPVGDVIAAWGEDGSIHLDVQFGRVGAARTTKNALASMTLVKTKTSTKPI